MAKVFELRVVGDTSDIEAKIKELGGSIKEVKKEAGKTNKEIENVTSNGGAIAILDRLTGGLASQFRDAFEATKLFNGSLKATRGALLATGIGALVVALGTIVAYWDEIVDFVKQTNENLEKQLSLTQQIQETLASESAVLEKQIELNELQGVANEELQKQQIQLLELRREQELKEIDILEAQLNRLKAQTTELTLWDKVKVAAAQYLGLWGEVGNVAVDRVNAQAEEIAALEAKLNSARESALDLSIQLFKINNPEESAAGVQAQERPDLQLVGQTPTAEPSNDPRVILEEGVADRIKAINEGLTQVLIEEADRRQAAAQAEANAKIMLEQNVAGVVGALAKEGSVVAKGLALGQTTLSTIEGVQAAYTTAQKSPITIGFPAYPFVQAAAAAAFGATQIAAILKTDAETGAGGLPDVSGGGGGAAAPSFNLVRGTGENQLLEGITRQQNPIEAYVVSDRVTSSAALNRNRASEASLG
jgi:hypothetical protein